MGTGTTLAAALALGIPGVGFELYQKRELIIETILENRMYSQHQDIMLSHYETTIKKLLEMI